MDPSELPTRSAHIYLYISDGDRGVLYRPYIIEVMSYTDKSSINDNHCNLNVTILYCALPDFCFLYFFFTCLIFMYSTIEYMNQKKNYPSFVAVFLNSMTPVSGGRPCLVAAAIRRVSSNEWPVTGTFKHLRKKVQSNLH